MSAGRLVSRERLTHRRRLRRSSRSGEGGYATAELAVALPTLVLLLAFGVWLQSAVALRARCLDAARAGARAAARGDPDNLITGRLAAALPPGAAVSIRRAGATVTVTVTDRASAPAGLSSLVAGVEVSAAASAESEPTDGGSETTGATGATGAAAAAAGGTTDAGGAP